MKRTIAILMSLIMLVIMLLPNISNAAAEAVVKISTDATLVEVGDTVTITVSQYQTGTTELKKSKYVQFKLSFDEDVFSYQGITDGFTTSDSDGTITVTTTEAHAIEDISSVSLTFKALKSTSERRNSPSFRVTEFKSGEDSGSVQTADYSVMEVSVDVREKYEGTVSIQADKTSVAVERKVNISLAQTIPTNYIEATISYDKNHFEFIAPANSAYEADTSTDGQVTVKASGADLADVTLLFKAIAETEPNSPSAFSIISYKAGNNSEEASNAHLYYSKGVSVAVTERNRSTVQIKTNLTDDTAILGDTFIVTVSQDKPTDYLQFDLFYNQEIFGYIELADNNAQITAVAQEGMLSITATGSQISEINLKFQALKLTEGRNEQNKEYIKVSNFLSGDNSGDTDIAVYNIQQVGIKVVEAPVVEEPKPPIEELPDTGSILTTIIVAIIAVIAIAVIILRKYTNNKKS